MFGKTNSRDSCTIFLTLRAFRILLSAENSEAQGGLLVTFLVFPLKDGDRIFIFQISWHFFLFSYM